MTESPRDTHPLLEPLTHPQQRLIDVVGDYYAANPGEWPIYDFVAGTLEREKLDAVKILVSFPRIVRYAYSAVVQTWGPGGMPDADQAVALTVVGMHHSAGLRKFPPSFSIPAFSLVDAFIELLGLLARTRQNIEPSPTTPRRLEMTHMQVIEGLQPKYRFDQLPITLLCDLIKNEPLQANVTLPADMKWTINLPNQLIEFEDVSDLGDYLRRLEGDPTPARLPEPVLRSPLDLVTAMQYLNTTWRLAYERPLFQFDDAEQIAKLAHDVNTADEFESRMTGLSVVLRSALKALPFVKGKREPLVSLGAFLLGKLGSASEVRIKRSIRTLEDVLAVRDAGHHPGAGDRAARALNDLGIGVAITDWNVAWTTIRVRTIEALDAIREEISATI
jgi:hypothetical protein